MEDREGAEAPLARNQQPKFLKGVIRFSDMLARGAGSAAELLGDPALRTCAITLTSVCSALQRGVRRPIVALRASCRIAGRPQRWLLVRLEHSISASRACSKVCGSSDGPQTSRLCSPVPCQTKCPAPCEHTAWLVMYLGQPTAAAEGRVATHARELEREVGGRSSRWTLYGFAPSVLDEASSKSQQ